VNPARKTPLVLVILDGWGLSPSTDHNAIALARTPTYDELLERFPHATLVASGEAVGLPPAQMGNSEVGHMNLGAGRIVYQDLTRIDKSIADGEFQTNRALQAALAHCRGDRHALHLVGLLSDGGVHSHQRHLYALLDMAARAQISRVFVHCLMDGRDTSPRGGAGYVAALEHAMADCGAGRIATLGGRYFGMDRDRRWDRTRRAYDAMTAGIGNTARSARALVESSYAADVTDEFIEPGAVVDAEGAPVGLLADDDTVIHFNFRADRARQLTSALAFDAFDGFDRTVRPRLHVTTMTLYKAEYGLPVAFEPQTFSGSLAEAMPNRGLTNLRLAETEKYAHVTYFFSCGEEQPYPGEDRILVPSPKVPTYDLKPEMSAVGITDALVADIEARRHDVIICNFANADMVGHTGRLDAAIVAVETLDQCLERIVTALRAAGGRMILTADHGNAEQMWDATRQAPHTAHTSNPVPVILVGDDAVALREGSLRDVAPTMLRMLELEPTPDMTGADLRTGR